MKKEIAIILILVSVVGVLWFTKSPRHDRHDPKETTTYLTIAELAVGLVKFRSDMDRYPTAEEGLTGLILNNGSETWKGPYLNHAELPVDEWNNEFVYINKDSSFALLSSGKDGRPGTKDDLEFKTEQPHPAHPAAQAR